MPWGSLQVGRINLRETYTLAYQVNATTGEQSVTLEGMESSPPATDAQIVGRSEDVVAMLDQALPVIFSGKQTQSGFYTVKDVGAVITEWPEAKWFTWNLSLARVGAENAVDMESRLGSVVRVNDFSNVGERWHAPSVGAYGYFTGTTQPSSNVSRVMSGGEGTLTVFRGVPAGVNPVWGITAPNYLLGRSRVLIDGVERSGVGIRVVTGTWVLTNGLVRVTPLAASAMLKVEYWDGAAWSGYDFDLTVGSDLAPPFNAITVVRNDFECVVLRLMKTKSPSGRILVDLTLRRGARFVEGFMQTDSSATLGVKTDTAVAGTNSTTGWVRETANDVNGNRLVVGSSKTFTANTTNTGLSKAAVTQLPFYIGGEIDGSSAVAGDTAAHLYDQFIGSLSEQVLAVKR